MDFLCEKKFNVEHGVFNTVKHTHLWMFFHSQSQIKSNVRFGFSDSRFDLEIHIEFDVNLLPN